MASLPSDQDYVYNPSIVTHHNILSISFETFVYGIYVALFPASVWLLTRTKARNMTSRSKTFIITIISLLFIFSTGHWGISLAWITRSSDWEFSRQGDLESSPGATTFSDDPNAAARTTDMSVDRMYVAVISFLLSDIALVWTVWRPAWRGMRIAVGVISGILFALYAGSIIYSFTAIYGTDIPTFEAQEDGNWQLGILIAFFGSLVNKLWLFAAWAGIVWRHRGLLEVTNKSTEGRKESDHVPSSFVLLVESGVIYLLLWTAYTALFYVYVSPSRAADNYATWSYFVFYNDFMVGCMVHIAGIHNTLLLLFASKRRTLSERIVLGKTHAELESESRV